MNRGIIFSLLPMAAGGTRVVCRQRFRPANAAEGPARWNVDLRFKHQHPSRWH